MPIRAPSLLEEPASLASGSVRVEENDQRRDDAGDEDRLEETEIRSTRRRRREKTGPARHRRHVLASHEIDRALAPRARPEHLAGGGVDQARLRGERHQTVVALRPHRKAPDAAGVEDALRLDAEPQAERAVRDLPRRPG